MKNVVSGLCDANGQIVFEYDIPRLDKRIDVVLLYRGIVFRLEFKVGESKILETNIDQVLDYALDLKNFHKFSEDKVIAPILIATNYSSRSTSAQMSVYRRTGLTIMIKELIHDPLFLQGKAEMATKEDLPIAQDLLDTLMAHKDSCVGMAANMIGIKKCIIAFLDESGRAPAYTVMLNPEIIKKDGVYNAEEGCLSLLGDPRPCKRYKSIKVKYQNLEMQTVSKPTLA